MKCRSCKRRFPSRLINRMTVSTPQEGIRYYTVCPLCALEISNRICGDSRTKFDGFQAKQMLEEAQEIVRDKGA